MMSDGVVTVLIPTYNRAYCLARAIDSALAQTYPHLEVLIVDDGSTDSTRKLVEGTYGRDDRVRYLYQSNRGVSAARNHGLRQARGDYIAFLDSDDVWKPWKLQAQVACLKRLPAAGMIWSDMEAVDPEGRVHAPRYLRTMYHAYRLYRTEDLFRESYPVAEVVPELGGTAGARVYTGIIYAQMFTGNLVHTSTVLIRRERLEKVKAFREDFLSGEDYDFHFRTCREGPVAFLDLPTTLYQLGMNDRLTRFTSLIAVNYLKTITAALERHDHGAELPRAVIRRILARAHAWVGGEFAKEGDCRSARGHLARSLTYRPWQPRVLAELALCCLPGGFDDALRGAFRGLKACLRSLRPA
jgi:glycosyltransferase involved in cell wall biosynthesis